MDKDYNSLLKDWQDLKLQETQIKSARIFLEKSILADFGITEHTVETNHVYGDVTLTLIPSTKKKIDDEILALIVKEHDLKEQFKLAFKRKYEVNSVPFKKLDENVQELFSKAITIKANKPTFKVSTTVS